MASSTCSHVASATTINNNGDKKNGEEELCTLECTVCTGFEEVAREEAMEVLGVEDVRVGRGNILISMPVKDATKVRRNETSNHCYILWFFFFFFIDDTSFLSRSLLRFVFTLILTWTKLKKKNNYHFMTRPEKLICFYYYYYYFDLKCDS